MDQIKKDNGALCLCMWWECETRGDPFFSRCFHTRSVVKRFAESEQSACERLTMVRVLVRTAISWTQTTEGKQSKNDLRKSKRIEVNHDARVTTQRTYLPSRE